MIENKTTEPTNPEEEETTTFAVVLPIKLPEELKKKIADEIKKIAIQTLASHDIIEEEDSTTASAEAVEPQFMVDTGKNLSSKLLKDKWWNNLPGFYPKRDFFL